MSAFQRPQNFKIAVIGLGYVGLPLAVHLAKYFPTTGFDISQERLSELHKGFDRTAEIDSAVLRASSLHVTGDFKEIEDAQVYIVTVPTPVHEDTHMPDLTPVEKACQTVGSVLKKGDVVVFESTVYPGVTEDVCGPLLEKVSGFKQGVDFFLGYSPERINPGDKVHTVDRITKVVAGENTDVTEFLKTIYGAINGGQIFCAASIKTAEAAKVIENTQRDINIAFMNELTAIFQKLNISIFDVLEAAGTKWNFLPFKPGLVGGHCIGVDPYYLARCAQALGHEPEIILSGRRINENMSQMIAQALHGRWAQAKPAKILMLGLTFKEDVPDLRNTKVIDLIGALEKMGHQVHVHDPCADPQEAKQFYGIDLETSLEGFGQYDMVIGAVPHAGYIGLSDNHLRQMISSQGFIGDLKGMWRHLQMDSKVYWSL